VSPNHPRARDDEPSLPETFVKERRSPDAGAEAAELLETLLAARGLSVAALAIQADGTLAASDRRALKSSRRSRSGDEGTPLPESAGEIELDRELGRGGMGVVNLGVQRSLRRQVAIKRPLDPEAGDELLAEAWALAHLAHPNVVPVHALTRLGGVPGLVMKRISGVLFAEVLARPETFPGLTTEDPLGFHLRTLIEVTRAVEHAHRRGVVHLDLKPANVMIGDFGEVYVLDWGLSARLSDEAAHLPRAADIQGVAGTPEYMAPELAMGAGEQIDERTDVYLLGAMLHEIVTGLPRHRGRTPIERVYRACLSEPPVLDASVPEALARILRSSTHARRQERPESAAAFRHLLEGYLRHREADALFARSEREIEALEREVRGRGEAATTHHLFGAARFALREASLLWPDRKGQLALLARLHNAMARFALAEGRLSLAASHLALAGAPDPELAERLEAMRREGHAQRENERRLLRLGKEEDLETGRRIRSQVTFGLAATFLVSNLAMGALERRGAWTFGYLEMILTIVAFAAIITPYAWWRREQLFPNRAATALWGITLAALAVVAGHWAVSYATGLPFRTALALTPLYYTLCFGALSTLLDARLWPAAITQVPTALLVARHPEWTYEILGVGGTLSVLYLAVIWALRPHTRSNEKAPS
jgi:hypothetical protein